jgi:hypothetical protein
MLDLTLPEPTESRWEWPASSRVPEPVRKQIEAAHDAPQQQARLETENARLEQQIARQDQRLARLERGITMLRVELYGGTVKQLRDAGITVKAGNEPADGKIQPLHEKMIDGIASALANVVKQERAANAKRLDAIEATRMRYVGVFVQGTEYRPGMVVSRSGSSWHCNVATTAVPGQSPDWEMMTKAGRDGRDAPAARRSQSEPVLK